MLTRSVHLSEIRSIDPQKHTVHAVISTASVDRHRTIFQPGAWDARLDTYRANPILCWGHPLGLSLAGPPPPENLIGKALEIGTSADGAFEALFEYAVDANPRARQVFELMEGGYLKAYSHGSIIHGYVDSTSSEEQRQALRPEDRAALEAGEAEAVFTDAELVEVSQVYAGSNRDALARAVDDGVVPRNLVEGLLREHYGLPGGIPLEALVQIAARAHTMVDRVERAVVRLEQLLREPEAEVDVETLRSSVRTVIANVLAERG